MLSIRKRKGGNIFDDIGKKLKETFNPDLGRKIKDALTSDTASTSCPIICYIDMAARSSAMRQEESQCGVLDMSL